MERERTMTVSKTKESLFVIFESYLSSVLRLDVIFYTKLKNKTLKKENINSLNKTRRNRLATFREGVVNKNNHVRLLRRVLRHPNSFFNPTKLTAHSTPTK